MTLDDNPKDKSTNPANGDGSWEQEEVYRREGGEPGTLSESLEAQLEVEKQRGLRVVADFENHKRRVRKERETLILYANEKLLKEFLPALDDLERALVQAETGGEEQTLDSFVQGVRLILNRILVVLERSGAVPFSSVGEPFDPTRHEAVMQRMEKDAPPSSVLEELERGYMLYNRLLRPAKTVVNALRAPKPKPRPEPEPAPEPHPVPEPEFDESSTGFDFVDAAEVAAENEVIGEVDLLPEYEAEAAEAADAAEEIPSPDPLEPPEPPEPRDDPPVEFIDPSNPEESGDDDATGEELTGGAFEIDEDALGSLDDWEKEYND